MGHLWLAALLAGPAAHAATPVAPATTATAADAAVETLAAATTREDAGAAPPWLEGYLPVAKAEMTAGTLRGLEARSIDGTAIGRVTRALPDSAGRPEVVLVDVGAFLGTGPRETDWPLAAARLMRRDAQSPVLVQLPIRDAAVKDRPVVARGR